MSLGLALAERGVLPDAVVRAGIRRLLAARLEEIGAGNGDATAARHRVAALASEMRSAPVALATERANEQHYEVPAEFFARVLGQRLKYSCCYWPRGVEELDQAEEAALAQVESRAGIEDGMEVLELGCGWGSLSLWLAARHRGCRILSVSNSAEQRRHIEAACRRQGLDNLEIVTADMNEFSTERRFDRVVSVEMFEHMRNYEELLGRVRGWLRPEGKLFLHVFCHRSTPYLFEDAGASDWMARHFFTGGLMPSEALLREFERELELEHSWRVDGRHYEKTALAWLANLDADREACLESLAGVHGTTDARRWLERWRIFFLACAELFGYRDGSEWMVSHTLWRPAT